jgi:Kef-type K+ transport system membrane component KefB
LAAAIFDDILGLVLLTVVTALVHAADGEVNRGFDFLTILIIVGKSFMFIGLALALGRWGVPLLFRAAAKYLDRGSLLTAAFGVCLAYSMLAELFGLAPIIGAFFAGLVIQPHHISIFQKAREGLLEDQLEPLSTVFVPLFFVFNGMKIDLSAFIDPRIFLLVFLLSAAAIGGKVLAGAAAGRSVNRWVVGVGMVPRGEVELIFASVGISLTLHGEPLLSPMVFGAVIAMVTITSLVSPIWLSYLLKKNEPTLGEQT